MNDDVYEKYKLAGEIAAKARKYGSSLIKPGIGLLEIANKTEGKILEEGAGLAFPVNISINEIAAHYSPVHDDKKIIHKGDVVKLDLGTHIDGYIADTAVTIEVKTNRYEDMIKASSDALDSAINQIKPNIKLYEIGKTIQEIINSYSYKPIDNLTGHSMEKYNLHAGMSVPNIFDKTQNFETKVDDVFAIEPFATDGAGHVKIGSGSNIFICKQNLNTRFIRNKQLKFLFAKIRNRFKTLPFAQRWIEEMHSGSNSILRKLLFLRLIKQYPQLIDAGGGIVTQKEHTMILNDDGCEVIT